jgi:hypothetical protein
MWGGVVRFDVAGEGNSPFGVAGEKFNVVSVRREESIVSY